MVLAIIVACYACSLYLTFTAVVYLLVHCIWRVACVPPMEKPETEEFGVIWLYLCIVLRITENCSRA